VASADIPIRVLIADDHAPLRRVVAETLAADGFEVCWEASDAVGAVEGATTTKPEVCLLDIRMPGNGIAAARIISDKVPATRIVMLTASRQTSDFLDALRAGADGYLLKDIALPSLGRALRAVFSGETSIPRELTSSLVDHYRHHSRRRIVVEGQPVKLSEREWEILELLADGLSTADIASRVFVAQVTVRSHISSLFKKLRVSSREEAVDRMLG
jgi:two-component system, NarL family, nitrate/nitrite response regulator NarL